MNIFIQYFVNSMLIFANCFLLAISTDAHETSNHSQGIVCHMVTEVKDEPSRGLAAVSWPRRLLDYL